jgi:Flp pilus assembly pilin Flp
MLNNHKGQSTLEYALIIAVVVAGLLAMQIYMKRGVQGKLRESIDEIGEQYSAGNVTAKYTTQQLGPIVIKEEFGTTAAGGRGASKYEVITPAEITRTATGTSAEKITTELGTEDLFD